MTIEIMNHHKGTAYDIAIIRIVEYNSRPWWVLLRHNNAHGSWLAPGGPDGMDSAHWMLDVAMSEAMRCGLRTAQSAKDAELPCQLYGHHRTRKQACEAFEELAKLST